MNGTAAAAPAERGGGPGVGRGPRAAAPNAVAVPAGTPGLRLRLRRWWLARVPPAPDWRLGQRNIYILPTRAGLTFAATLVVMLLAAINYQLNLGYALTFLLAGAGLASMHMTHANLRGVSLHLRPATAGFAGQPLMLEVVVTNPGRERHGLSLRLAEPPDAPAGDGPGVGGTEPAAATGTADGRPSRPVKPADAPALPAPERDAAAASEAREAEAWCDVPAGGQVQVGVAFVPPSRGWHAVPPLVVATVFPFGLFRAWTVWRPAARVLAWPAPEPGAPPLPQAATGSAAAGARRREAGGELDGVRPWRRGDTMRQVAWKKVARGGELVSRETRGHVARERWLAWEDTAGLPHEQRLSRLSAWVLRAEREGADSGLRLPHERVAPGHGDAHRRAALDALARAP